MEDQTLVVAAPRSGKSGWMADRIIDHPGAVVSTTTRADLFENTAALRGRYGAVHIFNPEGIGGLPSTFRWNPLQGCDQPAIALPAPRADQVIGAGSRRPLKHERMLARQLGLSCMVGKLMLASASLALSRRACK